MWFVDYNFFRMAAENTSRRSARSALEEEDTIPGDFFGDEVGPDAKKQKVEENSSEVMQVLKSMMEMQQQQQLQMQTNMMLQMEMFQKFLEASAQKSTGSAASTEDRKSVSNVRQPSFEQAQGSEDMDHAGLTATKWETAVTNAPRVESKTLPADQIRHYVKCARKLEDCIGKHIRAEKNLEKVREDLRIMAEGRNRYPPGTRAWVAPGDAVELEGAWKPSEQNEYAITVQVPKGSSRFEVLKLLHHSLERVRKDVHREALEVYVGNLKPLTTRKSFFSACALYKKENVDSLSLEDGKAYTANGALALGKCEDLYAKIIEKIRLRNHNEKLQKEEHERREKEREDILLKTDPKVALKDMVKQVVLEVDKERPQMEEAPPNPDTKEDEPDNATRFIENMKKRVLQKNVLSPGEARGKGKGQKTPANSQFPRKPFWPVWKSPKAQSWAVDPRAWPALGAPESWSAERDGKKKTKWRK